MAELTNAIHGLAGQNTLADVLGQVAAEDLIYIAPAVLLWLYLTLPSVRPVLVACAASAAAVGCAAAIGLVDYVPRPFVLEHFTPLIPHAADASFPSDHLAALGAITTSVWLAARRRPAGALAGVSCVVAFARVFVGVHWVTDVAAGFAVGAVAAILLWHATAPFERWIDARDHQFRPWRSRPTRFGRGSGHMEDV